MSQRFSHGPIDFRSMPSAVKALMLANCVAFLMTQIVAGQFFELFGLVPAHVIRDRWVWQPATYLFLHGSFMHLLFNIFALWMFGVPIESEWGAREFLKYYFICGIGAALCSVALNPHSHFPVIGASGAVYGLLVAFAMLYPDAVIYLYFFFPIKASHMAILFGLIEFFAGTTQATPGVARFAHLGGMVVGYLYLRWWWIVKIRLKGLFSPAGRGAATPRRSPRRPSPEAPLEDSMAEVDRILDKISAFGKDSLNDEEREVLRRHSDRARKNRPEGNA